MTWTENDGRPLSGGNRFRDFADLALHPSRKSHSTTRHSSASSADSAASAPPPYSSSGPESRLSMPFRKMARHLGDSLKPSSVVLSYHDITLFAEDVKALRNDWLTDNNIAFWEEYLEREILVKYPQARIILLRPSITFLLMREPDTRQIRSALPDFSKVTHVFLPINDCHNVSEAEGGSHWSLLLVSAIDGVAFHYDSLNSSNYTDARLAARKMSEILGRGPLRFLNLEDSPQQENGSDCGVFVCILMRHLLVNRLLAANAREKVSMSMANKLIDADGGRKEMLKIIESLRKEGVRRRSRSASPFTKDPPRIE
ncbi:NEDD8-specific protease [Plectosphaerella cucumerina]|uniref:NEDD8-specific protease n=1 Tax=Plectosphaerella cucumerina TaxID=40658 RepID=A0A8K0TMN8_9PEZI|nr:NEDD8-specific protease [Plectosphaerella cucumerina]